MLKENHLPLFCTMLIGLVMLLLLGTKAYSAQTTAAFPYSAAAAEGFNASEGREYAKLLTLALNLKTNIAAVSQTEVLTNAAQLNLSPEGALNAEDIASLGRRCGAARILTGRLTKAKGMYFSKSVLFSVKEGRVTQRTQVSAATLADLAEKEIREFFPLDATDKNTAGLDKNAAADIAFVIDCSYAMAADWLSVKDGIAAAARRAANTGADVRIYLVPFSSKIEFNKASLSENLYRLTENLNRIKPNGKCTEDAFAKAMSYALKSILWRKQGTRRIVLISASEIPTKGFPEQYGILAKKAKIPIDAIMLGKTNYKTAQTPLALCEQSGGALHYTAYKQQVFNADGASRYVFYERGRMLYSAADYHSWEKGILRESRTRPEMAAPPEALTEIYGSDKQGAELSPYGMPAAYSSFSGERVINSGRLQNNVGMLASAAMQQTVPTQAAAVGSFLASDGLISLWVDIPDDNNQRYEYIKRKQQTEEFFYLGITLRRDQTSPYGIRAAAACVDLRGDDVPASLLVTLSNLAQKPDAYMKAGFLQPPMWIIRVKAYEVRADRQGEELDIRD